MLSGVADCRPAQVEIVRPLIVHGIIIVGAFERHAISRNALKKASMSDGAARITWIGAVVNLLLAVFKLFAGICNAPGAEPTDAAAAVADPRSGPAYLCRAPSHPRQMAALPP
jgi:hypothetical protein